MADRVRSFNFKAWQIAFLTGMVIALVSAFWALGFTRISQMLAIAGMVLVCLDHLLRPGAEEVSGNSLIATALRWLRQRLNRRAFLITATVTVWLMAVGLGGYGLWGLRYQALESLRAERTFPIDGFVLTAGNRPAELALVTLTVGAHRETVLADLNGKFLFPSLDSQAVGDVQLQALWKGLTATLIVDTSEGKPPAVRLQLPPGAEPFRISYLRFNGHALHFLSQKRLYDGWAREALGNSTHLAWTAPIRVLNKLAKQHSVPSNFEYLTPKLGKVERQDIELAQNVEEEPFFVGGWPNSMFRPAWESDILSLRDSSQGWSLEFLGSTLRPDEVPPTAGQRSTKNHPGREKEISYYTAMQIYFWRPASANDIVSLQLDEAFAESWKEFYADVMRGSVPADFGFIVFESHCGRESCVDPEYKCASWLYFKHRLLDMKIAVIENITNEAVAFDYFLVRQFPGPHLRSRAADDAALAASGAEERSLLPSRKLMPGEKLLVPLSMSFRYDDEGEILPQPVPLDKRESLVRELNDIDDIVFPLSGNNLSVTLRAAELSATLARRSGPLGIEKEYIYGPSLRVDSAVVDGVPYPVREEDPDDVELFGGYLSASCPFIFTASAGGTLRHNEGHVLYNRLGREREGIDEKQLSRFDGRILIKEMEDEISFIDSLEIRVESTDGLSRTLVADDALLHASDNRYLVLRRGEQHLVRFPGFRLPRGDSRYILVVKGYYVRQ